MKLNLSLIPRQYVWLAFALLLGYVALSIWNWDRERLAKQFDAGYDKAQKECEESKAAAKEQVDKDVAAKESLAAVAAEERQRKLDETLAKISAASSTALTLYRRSVNEISTLANGCRVPAGRMRAVNEALGHPASSSEADVREMREQ